MTPDLRRLPKKGPVFVDVSGRRLRSLRLAGALVVLPAVGYVCVLLSTVLGGRGPAKS